MIRAAILEDLYRRNLLLWSPADESEIDVPVSRFVRGLFCGNGCGVPVVGGLERHAVAGRFVRRTSPQDQLHHYNWRANGMGRSGGGNSLRQVRNITARGFVAYGAALDRRAAGRCAAHPRVLYLYGQAVWTLSEFAQAQPFIEKALEGFNNT